MYSNSLYESFLRQQSGQAIVLILVLTIFAVLGAIALVSTGIVTSEKMRLQDAADATAYNVSLLEARDLNYTAYMTRAKVANEVAIGQMVSLASWSNMLRTEPTYINILGLAISAIPTPITSTLGGAISSYANAMDKVYKPVQKVVVGLAKATNKMLGVTNTVYSGSQKLVHALTLPLTLAATIKTPQDYYANGEKGPSLSPFGWLALSVHYLSYYDLKADKINGFIKQGASDPSHGIDGYGIDRYAQVINDSRDDFTKRRACHVNGGLGDLFPKPKFSMPKIPIPMPWPFDDIVIELPGPRIKKFDALRVNCANGHSPKSGWDLTFLDMIAGINYHIPLPIVSDIRFGVDLNAKLDLRRRGGTQLVIPRKGDISGTNVPVWSATDVADLKPTLGGRAYLSTPLSFLNFDEHLDLPFSSAPWGVGGAFAHFGENSHPYPTGQSDMVSSMYGNSSSLVSWPLLDGSDKQASPSHERPRLEHFPVAGQSKLDYYMVNDKPPITGKSKTGDIKPTLVGLEAPYILIGLTYDKQHALSKAIRPAGNLALAESSDQYFSNDVMPLAVIGKAEVYYSQPSDFKLFSLNNSRRGSANLFNPYWDAKLVDTSYIDRILALTLQFRQLPLPQEMTQLRNSLNNLSKELRGLKDDLL